MPLQELSGSLVMVNDQKEEMSMTPRCDDADQYIEMWKDLWSRRDTAWHLDRVHPWVTSLSNSLHPPCFLPSLLDPITTFSISNSLSTDPKKPCLLPYFDSGFFSSIWNDFWEEEEKKTQFVSSFHFVASQWIWSFCMKKDTKFWA